MAQRIREDEDPAGKFEEVFRDLAAGRRARAQIPEPSAKTATGFMRWWQVFTWLDGELDGIARGKGEVSGLVIGAGVAKPLLSSDEDFPAHLARPMSFEAYELASSLERLRRRRLSVRPDFDWSVRVIEKDPDVAEILRTQRSMTLVPLTMGAPDDILEEYIHNFLTGSKKYRVPVDSYGDLSELVRRRVSLREVTVAAIPASYRERVKVDVADAETAEIEAGAHDVILCLMGGDYISEKQQTVERLMKGLRSEGVLVTDQLGDYTPPEGYHAKRPIKDIGSLTVLRRAF